MGKPKGQPDTYRSLTDYEGSADIMDKDVRVDIDETASTNSPTNDEANVPASDVSSQSDELGEKKLHHEFNEQTHYVPKSTIITVRRANESETHVVACRS